MTSTRPKNCGFGFRNLQNLFHVGGKNALKNGWPWQAALLWPEGVAPEEGGVAQAGDPYCGGSLITASHILTAAHCIEMSHSKLDQMRVRLGEHDFDKSGNGHP